MSDRGSPRSDRGDDVFVNREGRHRLGVGSALDAIERLGANRIEILFTDEGRPIVSVWTPSGRVEVESGGSLQEALSKLLKRFAGSKLTLSDAAARKPVRLPEGGVGLLVYVDRDHVIATVLTTEGRHRRIPVALLDLVPEEG